MQVAGADKAVSNVMQWATRDDWADAWGAVLADHIVPPCEDLGIAPEALESILGSDGFDIVFACAVEDFFTRSFGGEQRNVIEDYLKRRGWREGGPAKIYLRALRASAMSLYEVVDLLPGRYLVLRDLIGGGEPVRVDERMGRRL